MSIDTVFKPTAPTASVTNAGGVQVVNPSGNQGGITTFRVVNLATVTQRLGYGDTAAKAAANAVAPTSGTGFAGGTYSVVMEPGGVETYEFPPLYFFAASAAAGFEMTPGQGA